MRLKGPLALTTRQVAWLLVIGLVLALFISLVTSRLLANSVTEETKDRELELVFGAIEAGPLAIARLQSASFAQQELSRLMSNPKLEKRGLISTRILGGAQSSFEFANWSARDVAKKQCLVTTQRSFSYPDAINPFVVEISRDRCFVINEERSFFKLSILASTFITVICCFLVFSSLMPVVQSIRRANFVIKNKDSSSIDSIAYLPIRSLVSQAIRSFELEKDAALSQLAAQVSHDIRSPLSSLSLALQSSHDLHPDTQKIVQHSVKRINEIANQLIQSHKQHNSLHEPASHICDAVKILKDVVLEMQIQLKSRNGILLRTDIDGELVNVRCESTELSRIASNLINNAVEAIGDNGTIIVALRHGPDFAQISVIDDGVGIPEEHLSKLGQRGASFGKVSGSSGLGLGLSHARKIVEDAGGSVQIFSTAGTGTTVQLKIPR